MSYVSVQGGEKRIINVHYYYYGAPWTGPYLHGIMK